MEYSFWLELLMSEKKTFNSARVFRAENQENWKKIEKQEEMDTKTESTEENLIGCIIY